MSFELSHDPISLMDQRRNLLSLRPGKMFIHYPPGCKTSNNYFGRNHRICWVFSCSQHLITAWILTSHHRTTLQKGIRRARQINFINSNLDSKVHIWFYYDIHHTTWLFLMENSEYQQSVNSESYSTDPVLSPLSAPSLTRTINLN